MRGQARLLTGIGKSPHRILSAHASTIGAKVCDNLHLCAFVKMPRMCKMVPVEKFSLGVLPACRLGKHLSPIPTPALSPVPHWSDLRGYDPVTLTVQTIGSILLGEVGGLAHLLLNILPHQDAMHPTLQTNARTSQSEEFLPV